MQHREECVSHGNAAVESGFSVNRDILVNHLYEYSVVAQHQVYDDDAIPIHAAGGITELIIDKPMLQYMKGFRSRYEECLVKKKANTEASLKVAHRMRATEQTKLLT